MSLVQLIDSLIDEIGSGLNDATIRNRLLTMREQAEAVDTALKRCNTALDECNLALHDACSDLERFKSDAQQGKLPPDQESLVQSLARSGGTQWISDMQSQHHADKLSKSGFVEIGTRMLRNGRTHVLVSLTDRGREYAVKNKLT